MNENFWNDWFGEWNDPGWLAVYAIVALLLIAGIAAWAMKKKRDTNVRRAQALRTEAARQETQLTQKDAETRRLEAEAEQARAEADRLEAAAAEEREKLHREHASYEERMRTADKLDPKHKGEPTTSTSGTPTSGTPTERTESGAAAVPTQSSTEAHTTPAGDSYTPTHASSTNEGDEYTRTHPTSTDEGDAYTRSHETSTHEGDAYTRDRYTGR